MNIQDIGQEEAGLLNPDFPWLNVNRKEDKFAQCPSEVHFYRTGINAGPACQWSYTTSLFDPPVQSNAMSVFQTSQILPTRSGPGLSVTFPGFHPEGVASVPLLLRTCWKAWI
jgi:hypothetical protein